MTSLHRMRRFGPFWFGLLLIAQLGGVLPLVFDHTFHAFEAQGAVSETHDHSAPGPHGDHRHGSGDVKDECCLMHHLSGVAPLSSGAAPVSFLVLALMLADPPKRLFNTRTPRLDRPPKLLSSV